MKKIVAIFLAAAMVIVGMMPTSFAAANHVASEYLRYYLDMSGRVTGWPTNSFVTHFGPTDTFSGFRVFPGPAGNPETETGVIAAAGTMMGKSESNQVMRIGVGKNVASNRVDVYGGFEPVDSLNGSFPGYNSGDIMHMSAQYYIPRVASYYSTVSKGMRMCLNLYEGSSTSTTFFPSTSQIAGTGSLLTFAPTSIDGGKFYFLGALEAKETWSAETRYTVDAVVTFGETPILSVYVNGAPLTFADGVTTDGVSLTTENVKLSKSSYGVASAMHCFITTVQNPQGPTYVYTDDWVFESLRPGSVPDIYNPVSFEKLLDGDSIVIDNGAEITVNVDLLGCSQVDLYAGDEKIGTATSAPYTFVIPSTAELGNTTLKAVAMAGNATFERSIKISLVTSYFRKSMNENFEKYENAQKSFDGGWYYPSSRFYGANLVENGWFIKPMTVTDKAKKDFDKSFVIGCDAGAGEKWIDQSATPQSTLSYGFQNFNGVSGATISGNTAEINWQMYMESADMDTFTFTAGQRLFSWDNTEKKLKWDIKGDTVYTQPKFGYWQNYVLTIDMSGTTKLSLTVDGQSIFENREATNNITSFNNIVWYLIPDLEKGTCIGLDEIVLIHAVPRPSFGSAVFYKGATSSIETEKVSADVDSFGIAVKGGLLSANLEKNVAFLENGKELTWLTADGDVVKSEVSLINDTIWVVPPRPLLSNAEYTVQLKKNALFADNATIGYDQSFVFHTKTAAVDVVGVEYYKNGTKIENISAATFAAGDKIKAKVTMCNDKTGDEPVYIILLGYNNMVLKAATVLPDFIDAGATAQTFETAEITVEDATGFTLSTVVCNSDFLPIADATIASGNQ
ncbi:MAG: hypothetical protein E7409_07295 [Ruminococcaceae bacterium]|nr:hypothetical protein [Oscillospiraceae bacterium]